MSEPLPAAPGAAPRLRGDLAVWLLICAELLTFAILFISFAVARWREPLLFAQGQGSLALGSGALNTVLLVSASAAVAHALHGARGGRPRAAARWLAAAIVGALLFLAIKGHELWGHAEAGHDLGSSTFWMFYWLLTGFHFLHVAVAAVLLALLWRPTRQGRYGSGDAHALETGAVFWHMVDLLWLVLFPLVYVAR